MDNEALNTEVYKKLCAEQDKFKGWLLEQSPEEILNHAYEYAIREDIILAMEYNDLTDEQAKAALRSPDLLSDIFKAFEKLETDHMTDVFGCIESRANDLIAAEKEAIRSLPVYTQTAEYAKEHGEQEMRIKSLQTNVLCRNAIEDAIAENYRDNCLNPAGARAVLEQFGVDRTCYVLAATVQDKDWDGRISDKNKAWAKDFIIPKDPTAWNTDAYRRFVVSGSHPGLVDLFVNQVRREVEQLKERKPSVLKKLHDAQAADMPKQTVPRKKEEVR